MDFLRYVVTPEGAAVVIGTGDDTVEVCLLEHATATGSKLMCKTCVRQLPASSSGIVSLTCPYCGSSQEVIRSTVYPESRSFPKTEVHEASVTRWAASQTNYQELPAPSCVYRVDPTPASGVLRYVVSGYQTAVVTQHNCVHEFHLCRRVAFGEVGTLLTEVYSDNRERTDQITPHVIAMFPQQLQVALK